MPIGTIVAAVAPWGAAAVSATSLSFTAPAGNLLICLAIGRAAAAAVPTISDSLGETWTPFGPGIDSGAITTRLFWKISTGAAQTVTVASVGAAQCAAVMASIPGAGTDFINYKTNSGAAAPRSVTMDPFTAGSACCYFLAASAGTTWTQPTGYAEVSDSAPATNCRVAWGFDQVADTPTISTTGTGIDSCLYGVEIKASGAPPVGGLAKVWNGSAWVEKPAKVWTGSAWVTKPVKAWNGSAWI